MEEKIETPAQAQEVPVAEAPSTTVLEVEQKQEKVKAKKRPVTIDQKDYGFLRKNKYEEERKKWSTTYILQHRHFPDKIVELRAASPTHACNMIHWKPNQVRVLGVKEDAVEDVVDNVSKMITGMAEASISGSTSVV